MKLSLLASALSRISSESAMIRSPRSPGSRILSPLRNTITDRANEWFQSSSVMGVASGVNQAMSPISDSPPCQAAPWKKRRLRSVALSLRILTACRANSSWAASAVESSQSIQVMGLSWQ